MESRVNIKRKYKCLHFLFVFYLIYCICFTAFASKFFPLNIHPWLLFIALALATSRLPFDDIIAEIYGLKTSTIFYWSMVITRLLVALTIYFAFEPKTSIHGLNFHLMASNDFLDRAIFNPICYFFAWWVNIYLLTKWRILMQGRWFWMRSIGASGVAIVLVCIFFTIVGAFTSNGWPSFSPAIHYFVSSCVLRLGFVIIFAYPSNIIVNILRVIEDQLPSERMNFNPFKLSQA